MARNLNTADMRYIRGKKVWPLETPTSLKVGEEGGEFLGVITAATEPTLTAKQWCIWIGATTYLVVHNGTAQVKVALS